MNNDDFFITHLIVDELPDKGLSRLYFYTATAVSLNQGKYYWGTDNNSFDEENMKRLEDSGQIIKLPQPKKLERQKCLWLDSEGRVFYANIKDPYEDTNRELVFAPNSLSRIYQIYIKSIGSNVPSTYLTMSI